MAKNAYDSTVHLFQSHLGMKKTIGTPRAISTMSYVLALDEKAFKRGKQYCFDVWVGEKGNNRQGICLKVTGSKIQKVMAGGLDINNDKLLSGEGFKPVGNMWRVTYRTNLRP